MGAARIDVIKVGERRLIKDAEKGDSVATYRLGMLYEKGHKGIKKDLKKALNFYEKTIEIEKPFYSPNSKLDFQFIYKSGSGQCHSADAMYHLALLYSNEKKGMKDLEKALDLLKRAHKEKLFLGRVTNKTFNMAKEIQPESENFLNKFGSFMKYNNIGIKKEDIFKEIEKVEEKIQQVKVWFPLHSTQNKIYKILNF